MKKKLALVLSFAMLLSIFAFVGKTVMAEEELSGKISVQAEKDWMPYYEAAANRVKEKHPGVEIKLIETGSFDHLDTIDNTDVSNPDVADLFAIPADRIYGLSDAEALAPIDAEKICEAVGGWEDFEAYNKGIGGNLKVEDEYLAFPFNIETLINFVNAKNAEEAGVDLEKTIELNDLKDCKIALLPAFDAWYGVALINAAGIELLGKDEEGKLFSDLSKDWAELEEDKQALITSLFNYWKLNLDANATLFDADAGWGYIDDQFASGKGGVIRLGGPWDTNSISKQAGDGEDLKIFPIGKLTVNEKPLKHWQGGWGLAVNARVEDGSPEMAICEAMIAEIVNPEYAVDLFKATGKILENVSADVYKDSKDLKDVDKDVIAAVIESYKDAPARPLFTEWGKVWDTWKNAVLSWNSVKPENVEAAYKELQASFQAMMENFESGE